MNCPRLRPCWPDRREIERDFRARVDKTGVSASPMFIGKVRLAGADQIVL